MSVGFLLTSLLWTGFTAALAEVFTRGRVNPHFAQYIWRFAALLMVLPWFALAFSPLLPDAPHMLPDFPDLADFAAPAGADAELAGSPLTPANGAGAIPIGQLLFAGLALGWLVRAGLGLAAQYRLHVLKTAANHPVNPDFTHICAHWAALLQLSTPPKIALMSGHRSPFVTGLVQHTLYLPEGLDDPVHIGPIIAHECVHISRGDLFTRPFERAVADLLWFSPFAWLARARLDYYREAVCDAETVSLINAPVAYARSLAHVARLVRPMPNMPIAAFILNKRKTLFMRISTVLEPNPTPSRQRRLISLAALLMAAPLAFAQGLGDTAAEATQTFSAPVIATQGARVTSHYGLRKDPFTETSKWHAGIDIAGLPIGTPLATPAAGEVVFAGTKTGTASGYGKLVDVKLDTSGDIVRFAQLGEIKVALGDRINAGDTVGLLGSSGRSTGPHLHLEYQIDGKPHNPAEIEGLTLIPAP